MSTYDPTDIDRQLQDDAERKARKQLDRDAEAEDFKWLMGSKRGRRIVWRFLDRAGVFRLSFNTNSMTMAFNEGNRNEGLRILAQIHTLCPELYPVMVKEQIHDNRNADDGSRNDH